MAAKTRKSVVVSLSALCWLLVASTASAQWAEISQYSDFTPAGGDVANAYVELFDISDFSQCNYTCYHHSYTSSVTVSSSVDSDSDGGSGLGPYNLEILTSTIDDEGTLEAGAALTCTAAGPITAIIPPQVVIKFRPFNLHYDYVGVHQYEPNYDSDHRICAASPVTRPGHTASTMTMSGTSYGFLFYVCYVAGCQDGTHGTAGGFWPAETPSYTCGS